MTAEPSPEPPAGVAAAQPGGPQGGLSLIDVRRLWPDVLEALKTRRRLVWMVLSQNAHVVDVDPTTLTVGFNSEGPRESFLRGGGDEVLRQTAIDVIGMDWRIDSIVDPSHVGDAPVAGVSPPQSAPPPQSASQPQSQPTQDAPPESPPAWASEGAPPVAAEGAGLAAAREALQPARSTEVGEAEAAPVRSADDDVDPDDLDAETAGLDSEALLSQTLGARLIEEIKHD